MMMMNIKIIIPKKEKIENQIVKVHGYVDQVLEKEVHLILITRRNQ